METIYVDPENYGIDSGKLREMLEVLEKEAELHSISVKYEGKTILEGAWKPFTLEDPQMMHSLSKTGTAICVGFALDEGKLKLEAPFLDYIREDLPEEYDPALEKITVYDLLTMQAGSPFCCNNVWFSRLEKNWETAWLREKKILEDIGKVFHYDSGCSYTLSRIVTKVMGKNCRTLLDERVFEKMGFREIRWLSSPEGHSTGGWGLYLTAREISELGVLFLRKGKWKGEQLIPAWWVETLSKPQVAIPGCAGKALSHYAYHIKAGKEMFAAEGAFGQFLLCFRNFPVTIGITAGTTADRIPDICLAYIKEAFQQRSAAPELRAEHSRNLKKKTADLSLAFPKGEHAQWEVDNWMLMNQKFSFSENPRGIQEALFLQENDNLEIWLKIDGEEKQLTAGFRKWIRNDLYPGNFRHQYHCLAYAFDGSALRIKVALINTSYVETYTLRPTVAGDSATAIHPQLTCSWQPNVTYLPPAPDNTWHFTATRKPE